MGLIDYKYSEHVDYLSMVNNEIIRVHNIIRIYNFIT